MLTVTNNATFDWAGQSLHDCARGNALDTHFTLKLLKKYKPMLEDLGVEKMFQELISPLLPIFADMEFEGIHISEENLDRIGAKLQKKNIRMHDGLYKHQAVHRGDNLTSNPDQVKILFTRSGGFELYPPIYTDSDNPSTNKECLDTILQQVEDELESRNEKLAST